MCYRPLDLLVPLTYRLLFAYASCVQKKPIPTTLERDNQIDLTPNSDKHSYSAAELLAMGVTRDPIMAQILEYQYEGDPRRAK